jgi:hypothetical protein
MSYLLPFRMDQNRLSGAPSRARGQAPRFFVVDAGGPFATVDATATSAQ